MPIVVSCLLTIIRYSDYRTADVQLSFTTLAFVDETAVLDRLTAQVPSTLRTKLHLQLMAL